ncbi:MAG: hypothetical protein WDO13_06960 [Verrucomicrobiota bacterium]
MKNDKENKKAKQPPRPLVKPAHPDVKGAPAPDDNDPDAQYEDKDES